MFRVFTISMAGFTTFAMLTALTSPGMTVAQSPQSVGPPSGTSYLDRQRMELARTLQQRQMRKDEITRQAQERQARVDREIAAFKQQQYQDKLRYNIGIYGGMFNTAPVHLDNAEYYRRLADQSQGEARRQYLRWADWHRDWARKVGR
jgi:hypothetical protein